VWEKNAWSLVRRKLRMGNKKKIKNGESCGTWAEVRARGIRFGDGGALRLVLYHL